MTNLVITPADVVPMDWGVYEKFTGPAVEAINAGQIVRLVTTTGQIALGNGTTAAEARILGVSISTVVAGQTATAVKRGIVNLGHALSAVAWDAPIYASDTDGTLADSAGTVSKIVGRVVPGWGATTADKLLLVDLQGV